ncbi:hypothetical protein Tco_0505500 [Tanacetum coccineum]
MACMNLQVQNCPLGCDSKINDLNKLNDNLDRLYNDCYIKVQAYQNAVKTLESQRAWYQNNQLAYEEKIRVLQRDLENTSNELKYSEKINAEIKMEKQDLQAKLDNSLSRCINKNVKGTRYDSSKTKTKVNPVKALAKWVWKPKQAVLEHVSKSSRASKVLTRYDYVDVYGRFKSVLAWDFQKH